MQTSLQMRALGAGDPVLLLGASGASIAHMDPLAERLARSRLVLVAAFAGYFPGSSTTEVDFDAQLGVLEEAVAERVGSARTIDVVGFSLGGFRALGLARRARLAIGRLVSLAGYAALSADERAGYEAFAELAARGAFPPGVVAQRFLSSGYALAHPERAAQLDADLAAIDGISLAAELRAMARAPDLIPSLGEVRAPVLARVGTADAANPVAKSEAIVHAVPKGTLELVEGAGHALLWEDFDGTVAGIERFFAR